MSLLKLGLSENSFTMSMTIIQNLKIVVNASYLSFLSFAKMDDYFIVFFAHKALQHLLSVPQQAYQRQIKVLIEHSFTIK